MQNIFFEKQGGSNAAFFVLINLRYARIERHKKNAA